MNSKEFKCGGYENKINLHILYIYFLNMRKKRERKEKERNNIIFTSVFL